MADAIDASHVALLTSTGNVVIGVFHTLSAGKAGQLVPGKTGGTIRTDALDALDALESTGAMIRTGPISSKGTLVIQISRLRSARRVRSIHMVYIASPSAHARLSKSCATGRQFRSCVGKSGPNPIS